MGSQQGDDLQLNGDLACANAEIRGALRAAAISVGGAAPLTSVAHDGSLSGNGTAGNPLSVVGAGGVGVVPFFDDFIHADQTTSQPTGWISTVTGPGGVTQMGLSTEVGTVGLAQCDVFAAPDTAALTGFRDWFRLETFPSHALFRLRADAAPTGVADFLLCAGHVDNNGVPGSVGVYFRAGFAANGNSNWFAVVSTGAPVVMDTGVLVDNAFHVFAIDFSTVAAQWTFSIDGVPVATIAAQGQQNKGLGWNLGGVGAFSTFAVADYFAFAAEISR